MQDLDIRGARVHNLKHVDAHIPRYSLTVFTGLSGSGKSSLAFDTIYAEGQRRYIETFSSYARGFLGGGMERPDVEQIDGLGPVISIEQKTTNRNPRSTVGTVTEVYDFFRLLYARAGEAISYLSGKPMVRYTEEQLLELLLARYAERRVLLLAPVVKQRKGHYKELFEQLRKKSYITVRVDGELRELTYGMKLDRYKLHSVEVQTDKLTISEKNRDRLRSSLQLTLKEGDGVLMVLDLETQQTAYFSRHLMDPETGLSYNEPAPHNFSFNSPNGSCPRCKGLGEIRVIDADSIMPDRSKSIYAGGILPLGKYKRSLLFAQLDQLCQKYEVTLKTPLQDLPEELIQEILQGSDEELLIQDERFPELRGIPLSYDGLGSILLAQVDEDESRESEKWLAQFTRADRCPECEGGRLNKEALHFFIDGKHIGQVASMELTHLSAWLEGIEERMSPQQRIIATEVLKEIRTRLSFLLDVGLGYLSMNRTASTLSGGESQRIRLATQIGTQLVEVLYILDEPSIGLHQRDNIRLIHSLQKLRDLGNTVIVVEHDKDMMLQADYIIDMGPKAGRLGGEIVFAGTPKEMLKAKTLTAQYISGERKIELSARRPISGEKLTLRGAHGNNLRGIDVSFPLGTLICVAGVSGSGKSTLINETLYPILSQHLYASHKEPLAYDAIEGLELIDKVVAVDQSPIGRTPRSNPATYTGVFTDIRNLFVGLAESKMRGYKPGRFSFNVSGGRCDTCSGNGYKTIEMNFLPDVYAPCEVCGGKRYNRETLEVRFKGKSIADVLDMTINMAVEFFASIPPILKKLQVLQDVGLGYIKLGQSSTTLSGGESQRIKLASELAKRDTGKTVYILDEPTTGLHFEDIRVLLGILNRLVDRGNTVIIIEHNLDIIRSADYIIEIGPEGGREGGQLLYQGAPEGLLAIPHSPTAPFLAEEIKQQV